MEVKEEKKRLEINKSRKPIKKIVRKKRKNKIRLSFIQYFIGCLILSALGVGALYGPYYLLEWQDKVKTENIQVSNKQYDAFAEMSQNYEYDIYKRMENYAKALKSGKQLYVAKTPYNGAESFNNIWLDFINNSVIGNAFWSIGLIDELYIPFEELLDWQKCVVYDINDLENPYFLLWYIEAIWTDGSKIKFMIDSETMEFYYVQVETYNNTESIVRRMVDVSTHPDMAYAIKCCAGKHFNDRFYNYTYDFFEVAMNYSDDGFWIVSEDELLKRINKSEYEDKEKLMLKLMYSNYYEFCLQETSPYIDRISFPLEFDKNIVNFETELFLYNGNGTRVRKVDEQLDYAPESAKGLYHHALQFGIEEMAELIPEIKERDYVQ